MVLKGIIFTTDAIIATSILIATIALMFTILNNTPYSRLKEFDENAYADSALNTIKHHPTFNQSLNNALEGKETQAKAKLRTLLRDVYGKKRNAAITLQMYNENNTQTSNIRASYPANKFPEPTDQILANSRTFVTGENTGTLTLQTW